jgi:hypothetical protein
MYRFTSISLLLSTLLFVSICSAQQRPTTAVPNLIRYGGTLKDAVGTPAGAPVAAPLGVTFSIYKQQDGGAPVWMETQNVAPDASGQYTYYWEALQPQDCQATCSRKRSSAGWACRCKDKPSNRVCCW